MYGKYTLPFVSRRQMGGEHGLINCTMYIHQSICWFFLKIWPAGISDINLPSWQTKVYVAKRTLLHRGGQGLVDIRERLVPLVSFLLQHSKNFYLFCLKLNIYQILYMFVYMVLLKSTLILQLQEYRARICKRVWNPGIDSASLCSLAGRYDK